MSVLTRRDFLKVSGSAAVGLTMSQLGFDLTPAQLYAAELRIKGCQGNTHNLLFLFRWLWNSRVDQTKKERSSIPKATLITPSAKAHFVQKEALQYQIAVNENRLKKVRYRAPNSAQWKEVSWEWALDKIAANIKKSRDKSFVEKNKDGKVVNRTDGIASVGSAAMDNEECWFYQTFLRSLGLVYIEHQARI